MRNITPPSMKFAHKLLSICVLAAFAMPAYSVIIDQPAVKEGKRFGIFASVNPSFSHASERFTYTMANPSIYGPTGTLEQVLKDQDRHDTDEQVKFDGLNTAQIEMYSSTRLTKKLVLSGSVLLFGNAERSMGNYGAYWGASLDFGDYGELGRISAGGINNGLRVGKTSLPMLNTLNDSGTNISGRYTGIPDLTLSAYHMLAQSADVTNRRSTGWHGSNGVAAEYKFDFAPRHNFTIAAGTSLSKGHEMPAVWNDRAKGKAYMTGLAYEYGDAKVALDYGKRKDSYNGVYVDDIKTETYGIKLDYEITPRLSANLSYGHKGTENTKPISYSDWESFGLGVGYRNNDRSRTNIEERLFNTTKQDRYGVGLTYDIYKGISINASVSNLKTRNYVQEGEFTRRERLDTSIGASFSF